MIQNKTIVLIFIISSNLWEKDYVSTPPTYIKFER